MKHLVCRAAAWILAALLLCLCLVPASLAEGTAPTPEATAAPETTAETTAKPTMSPQELANLGVLAVGAKGEDVKKLQQRLKDLGYLAGKVDGDYGYGTKRAVKAFQRRNGLKDDGEAGPETQAKLFAEDAKPAPKDEKTDVLADSIPMLINKEHTVDEFFIPADLVDIKDVLGTKLAKIKYKGTLAVRTAAEALKDMLEAAKADGLGKKWQISAAYRTWDQQTDLLNKKIKSYRKKNKNWSSSKARRAALQTVAEPGTSEHHLGLAFDINKQGASNFAGTKHSKWLNEHCWEYGFIIRYQKEKEKITGFLAEPWHIRYVGVEHALYMKEHNLCLEEYVQGIEDGTIVLPGVVKDEPEEPADETVTDTEETPELTPEDTEETPPDDPEETLPDDPEEPEEPEDEDTEGDPEDDEAVG